MNTVLDTVEHARLIADLEQVLDVAGIPETFIHCSMGHWCGEEEKDWVINYWTYRETHAGLLLDGLSNPQDRCYAIAGALLRNFIDARAMTQSQLINSLSDESGVEPSVLLIPSLFVATHGKAMTSWQITGVYDMLLARAARRKPTVVYVEDFTACRQAFGPVFGDYLKNNYKFVGSK